MDHHLMIHPCWIISIVISRDIPLPPSMALYMWAMLLGGSTCN
jgi:hypothetical protein